MLNAELGMMNEAVAGLRQPYFIILYFNRLQSSVLCSRTENTKKVGRKYIGREKSCIFAAKTTI
jgi:hypothetical protein